MIDLDQLTDIKGMYTLITGPTPAGTDHASGADLQKHAQMKFIKMYVPKMIESLEELILGGVVKPADTPPSRGGGETRVGSNPTAPTPIKRGRGRPRKNPVQETNLPIPENNMPNEGILSILQEALKR